MATRDAPVREIPIVIIPCGGKKCDHPTLARYLYLGQYFRACLSYAQSLTDENLIFILSAKYGLLALIDRVDPYDLRMGQAGCVTADIVRGQAGARGLLPPFHAGREVVCLGGANYVSICKSVWPNCLLPLSNVGQIGKQVSWLRNNLGRVST